MDLEIESTVNKILDLLQEPDEGTEEHKEWIHHSGTIGYLIGSSSGIAPIYISVDSFYIYSVFIPNSEIKGDYIDDLLNWNFMASGGWGYSVHSEGGEQIYEIEPPLGFTSSKIIDGKQPIIYLRHFYGHPRGRESYIELDQRIAHLVGLHWVDKRQSYCRLDHLGDIKPVVSFSYDNGVLALADLNEFESFEYLSDTALLRLFDVMHFKGLPWQSGEREENEIHREEANTELHASLVVQSDVQSYVRGFQIIRPTKTKREAISALPWETNSDRKYAKFIALDWKNKRIVEWSCSPKHLGSYFEKSDLPFETSPAFFRAEVLLRYKEDPDKYSIQQRIIQCRGTWSLQYDINEADQVHAYLCDLANLPYEEQLYWKSFNELPKSGISARSYKTDFLAEWDIDYEPLSSLKAALADFPLAKQLGQPEPIWKKPSEPDPYIRLVGVVTDSPKEWEDQILELAKLIVDNLSKKNIRKVARKLGSDDPSLGSLKLLTSCLEAHKIDGEVVREIMDPLEEVWRLRTTGIAHHGRSAADIDRRAHFSEIVQKLDSSMRLLAELINAGYFDV